MSTSALFSPLFFFLADAREEDCWLFFFFQLVPFPSPFLCCWRMKPKCIFSPLFFFSLKGLDALSFSFFRLSFPPFNRARGSFFLLFLPKIRSFELKRRCCRFSFFFFFAPLLLHLQENALERRTPFFFRRSRAELTLAPKAFFSPSMLAAKGHPELFFCRRPLQLLFFFRPRF